MAMRARELVERLNQIKAEVKAGGCPPAVEAQLHVVTTQFKATYSHEQLKEALAGNAEVPTALEEAVTTLTMLWMQHRRNA
jgi:hypothetical protein